MSVSSEAAGILFMAGEFRKVFSRMTAEYPMNAASKPQKRRRCAA